MIGWTEEYGGQPLDDLISAWSSRVAHPQALEEYFSACRSNDPPEGPVELQPNPGTGRRGEVCLARRYGRVLLPALVLSGMADVGPGLGQP
jgi:hypothetical protein